MALKDRINLPPLYNTHYRPRLLDKLSYFINELEGQENPNPARLITIYADGGFGKSVLLSQFAQTRTSRSVCWCSLEATESDPTALLTLLAHSIINNFFDIEPDPLLRLIEHGDTQASVMRIAELLSDVRPHLLIFDDLQKSYNPEMMKVIDGLLEHLPEHSTIIVAARGDMTLNTGQVLELLKTNRAVGLRSELEFNTEEIRSLIGRRFGREINLDTARQIEQDTSGNIAAILLAGQVGTTQIHGELRGLENDREAIYRHLADKVFGRQPPEYQDFMKKTAVFLSMTPELCNELLEINHSQNFIDRLVAGKSAFIAPLGGGFRYHDLFRGFLIEKLQEEDEAEYRQVGAKASGLLARRERFEEAIDLLISTFAWDKAADLLKHISKIFYDTGRARTLEKWLKQFPERDLDQWPRLLLLQGKILNNDLGNPELAMSLFKRAEEQFGERDDSIGMAEAEVWQSVVYRMTGQAAQSLELATKGCKQLEYLKADKSIIAWAIRSRGTCHWTVGEIMKSLLDLRRSLKIFKELDDKYSQGLCYHDIGVCLEKQGKISGAKEHYYRAIDIWQALDNANNLANSLNSLGVLSYLVGDYHEALKWFKKSLELATKIRLTIRSSWTLAGIGDAYLGLGQYDQAIEAYTKSTKDAKMSNARTIEIYNTIQVGRCHYEQNELDSALNLSTQVIEIAAANGLTLEQGLAIALQARISMAQLDYATSFDLFEKALTYLAEADLLEQIKTRLWFAYSLFLDLKTPLAAKQLWKAISLTKGIGELKRGLGPTIAQTQQLLLHFLYRFDTDEAMCEGIKLLIQQIPRQAVASTRPGLQVLAFGNLNLIVADKNRKISQRGRPTRIPELLTFLLLQDEPRRWDEVVDSLWPEMGSKMAHETFRTTLKSLRRIVPSNYIIVQQDYYQINPAYVKWFDVGIFESILERTASMPEEETLPLYIELIALYQGPFLAGFNVGEWGSEYRNWCEISFLEIIKLAGRQLLRRGQPDKALPIIRQGLSQDNFREDLHRMMLEIYDKLGRYDLLNQHYYELGKIFEQENLPIDPETKRVYQKLARRDSTR